MNDVINTLRNHYYNAIVNCSDLEQLKKELPSGDYFNFFELMDGIIGALSNYLKEWENLDDDFSKEELEEIKLLRKKIELCIERKEKVQEEVNQQTSNLEESRNIVFASTSSGNNYFLSDLKDIPQEYYQDIINSLNVLVSEEISSNIQKNRSMTNSTVLKGIHEIKEYQVRLYYQLVGKGTNIIFINGVRIKKDNFSRLDREFPADRKEKTAFQLNTLKNSSNDKDYIDKICQQNKIILDDVFKYLEENKRGVKKNGK